MARYSTILAATCLCAALSGCGLLYQSGTRIRGSHLTQSLQVGESSAQVHKQWGEPDIVDARDTQTEIWSYGVRPNSNDWVAFLFYTSAKAGDTGSFVDLKFVDGRLATWSEAQHTMPTKEAGSYGTSIGTPSHF